MEKITKDNLNQVIIKSYLKHFGLKIKNGFIYNKDIAIYTEPLEREQEVLSFLLGISAVVDNPTLKYNQIIGKKSKMETEKINIKDKCLEGFKDCDC